MTAAERPDVGEGLTADEFAEFGDLRLDPAVWHQIDAAVGRIIAARETAAAEAVVGRVEAVHFRFVTPDGVELCNGCPDPWPCPTIAALRAGEAGDE